MREGDREVLARLELPLPMEVAVALIRAIAKAAERLGYTDVVIDTNAGHRIMGTPPTRIGRTDIAPGQPRSGPPPAATGAPTAPDP